MTPYATVFSFINTSQKAT